MIFSFLLFLYLSLPTFHFKGRKNEFSAQRGWRPLANRYHSRNHKIYREKSKSRNEAPDVEVWIRKLRQNTSRTGCPRKTQNRKAGLPIQTPGSTTLSRVSPEQELPRVPIDGAITLASHGAEFENVFYISDIEELPPFGGVLLLIKSFCFLYGLKVL